MDEIMEIAGQNDLCVVEDCAEALGTLYKKRHVGTIGHAGTFSFFGNKTISTGEGGMILFREEEHRDQAKILRDHGMSPERRYFHISVGYNYRMTNMQAALGVAQMEQVEAFVRRKVEIGEAYSSFIENEVPLLAPNPKLEWSTSSYWIYTARVRDEASLNRDRILEGLTRKGIDCRPAFISLRQMPLYSEFTRNSSFPVSERLSERCFSLPSAVSLSSDAQDRVMRTLKEVVATQAFVKTTLSG
jgi:perosamine synthetase